MKLIIDIPEEMYEFTKSARKARTYNAEDYVDLILNGTPLDEVKADVINIADGRRSIKVISVLRILDRIGKESEEK